MPECPKDECWFWQKPGMLVAPGHYANLEEALKVLEPVAEEGCGCTFGKCTRLHSDGAADFFEPIEFMTPDKAAMQLSYMVEGVKDNPAINQMVADTILRDRERYRDMKPLAKSRKFDNYYEVEDVLDLHHGYKTHCILTIHAPTATTEIKLEHDDKDRGFMLKAVGTMQTFLLSGAYWVDFGLADTRKIIVPKKSVMVLDFRPESLVI